MKSTHEIIRDYTAGEKDVEETNAALKERGAGFHLDPARNEITEEEQRVTVVGYYPEQANGYGLLDTGTGSLDKVQVRGGKLNYAVNEVLPGGKVNMDAFVFICGRTYRVLGDALAELEEA